MSSPDPLEPTQAENKNAATEICSAHRVRQLTFVHCHFNGGAIGTDVVAADTHVRAGV